MNDPYGTAPNRMHSEGPDLTTETRLIGVELTLVQAGRREEIQMFATERTFRRGQYGYGDNPQIQITLHTSNGDVATTLMLP